MLKKGDKCHVRLKSGEIVEAEYKGVWWRLYHWVKIGDEDFLAARKIYGSGDCRFVCMTGIKGNGNVKT